MGMLNKIVAAIKDRMETMDINVLGPGYVIAIEKDIRVARLKVSKTQLPAILLNYQRIKISRKQNTGRGYLARGSVVVVVDNSDLERSVESLNDYTEAAIEKLLESPYPKVDNTYLKYEIGETAPADLPEDDFRLATEIPCDIEFWK